MLSGITIETFNKEIANEEHILDIFDHLLRKGLDPFEAYDYIEQEVGQEKLFSIVESLNL